MCVRRRRLKEREERKEEGGRGRGRTCQQRGGEGEESLFLSGLKRDENFPSLQFSGGKRR